MRTLLLALIVVVLPLPLAAQSLAPAVGVGYGITQSRLRSGEAMSLEASTALASWANLQLRGEVLYQRGRISGRGCEMLEARYCIGGTDTNQLAGVGLGMQAVVGRTGPVTLSVPVGMGLYHRRTATTESEGPIEICVDGNQFVACAGNPPMRSVSFRTSATAPGYNAGAAVSVRVRGFDLYSSIRAHHLFERDSKAGALPLTFGVSF